MKHKNRRGLKKNSRSDKSGDKIRIIAINSAGITSKMESFDKVIFDRKPSIWFLQETKRKFTDSKMKAKNLINYQIFELKREKEQKCGGKGLEGH